MKKILLIILGIISLGFGGIGIFIPGLPTTPFLLLAAWLFLHSSDRLYQWLLSNKLLGSYLRKYKEKGLDMPTLLSSLSLMWAMIIISTICFSTPQNIKLLIIIVDIIGTASMVYIYRKKKHSK